MKEEVNLDLNLNSSELECLEIHNIFKQRQLYSGLEQYLEADKFKVWYNCSYNDNWYDLRPIYIDIIKDNKIINKVSLYQQDIDFYKKDPEEGDMLSFIITPKMIQ